MTNEVKVTGGVGAFFYAAIPGALAGAALLWLALVTGVIDLTKELKLERRMADRVGITASPLPPVNLIATNGACLRVDKSYLDGQKMSIYVVNSCHATIGFSRFEFRVVAPDGTVTKSRTDYLPGAEYMLSAERREIVEELDADDRTMEIHVRLIDGRSE